MEEYENPHDRSASVASITGLLDPNDSSDREEVQSNGSYVPIDEPQDATGDDHDNGGTDLAINSRSSKNRMSKIFEDDPDKHVTEASDACDEELLQRYHEACQHGDLATVKELLQSVIDITHDGDKEGVTGLHWASINNRLSVVKYLVSQGAKVDATAGTLSATPLHWAARYGYVYIVDYLLKHGANHSKTDAQGFDLLHLSVHSSNIMLLVYVLFCVRPARLDNCDPQGRTPLLWAAYQGDSLSVALLLRLGASVRIADSAGFTPLHWAIVKGQPQVLRYLLKAGADFFQTTHENKDCFQIANEMKTKAVLETALQQAGFDKQGYPLKYIMKSSKTAKITTFVSPFFVLGGVAAISNHWHPLFAFFGSITILLLLYKILKRFVLPAYDSTLSASSMTILKSPLVAGICFGTMVWMLIAWICVLMPYTIHDRFISNLSIGVLFVLAYILIFRLMFSDPGCIPRDDDHDSVKQTIQDLMDLGKFDTRNFCLETWSRKPLRSRFSYFNNHLVARFDHYCPWIYNDVGLKNHKHFLFFVMVLEAGIVIFVTLCWKYYDELDIKVDSRCSFLGSENLCLGLKHSLPIFMLMCWAAIQSFWIGTLISMQAFQTWKGVTNTELNALLKRETSLSSQTVNYNQYFNTTPQGFLTNPEVDNSDAILTGSLDTAMVPPEQRKRKPFLVCCTILGLDQWIIMVKKFWMHDSEFANSSGSTLKIPTDYGWKINANDFWLTCDTTAPLWQRLLYSPKSSEALLNGQRVDYYKLYELPKTNDGLVEFFCA